ncbi:helix-turn-helix transcriptional regulator [Burkholderia cepacia]|uniref:helix-turn-helix transcriptional regulator n=1 Tax=Burkholderia cepacia TaxID=292 RepID=UPI0015762897|nr:helix-turn-helix transcriptional regulator [Burkholderia cepacia]NTX20480.1 helix-turn-helix transcriptional regulator [Burkholderia cepacia]
MFSTLYFPLAAYLGTPGFNSDRERFGTLIFAGDIGVARQLASRWADDVDAPAAGSSGLQLHADMQLLTGGDVEAEEVYRTAQRMSSAPRQAMRAESCRNTAWQAFIHYRFSTALACFGRAADEDCITTNRLVEVRFGIVCVLYELGRVTEALAELDELRTLVEHTQEPAMPYWRELIVALKLDIAMQCSLRSSAVLQDHVYWQSGSKHGRLARMSLHAYLQAEESVADVACVQVPVLRARIDYLLQLREATGSERNAGERLLKHVNWARDQNLHDYQRTLRLEIALAMLGCNATQAADLILEPLYGTGQAGLAGHRQIEYLYCAAKTRQAQGRMQDAQQLYSRYALTSMECLREALSVRVPFLERKIRETSQLDDIGARLPARYRRAYSFLLENLEHADLSVRDIAVAVGVTERALQSAFRKFLNMSPSELIRRQRMERIRSELVDGVASDGGVLATATRWGVQSRSTLINGYRKQFDEAPSHTLGR